MLLYVVFLKNIFVNLSPFLCSHIHPPLSLTVHSTEALIGYIPMDNYSSEAERGGQCGITWPVKLLNTTCCTLYSSFTHTVLCYSPVPSSPSTTCVKGFLTATTSRDPDAAA